MRLRKADRLFRQYILKRDDYTCQRCRRQYRQDEDLQGLHVSHYWSRVRENTRFDPDNCVLLCYGCHRIWGHGDGWPEYTDFMKRKLGERGFYLLAARAQECKKKDDALMTIYIKQLLKQNNFVKSNSEVLK